MSWARSRLVSLGFAFGACALVITIANARPLELADKNCSDFRTWQEAQSFFLAAGSGDPNHLDTNHNGIACESLPGAPGRARTANPTAVVPVTATATIVSDAPAAPSLATATPVPPATATRTPRATRGEASATPTTVREPVSGEARADGNVAPTAVPLPTMPPPESVAPQQPQPAPSVWLMALAPTELLSEGGDPIGTLAPGDRVRVIAVGEGAALVATPDSLGTALVPLDPRVQLVAQ